MLTINGSRLEGGGQIVRMAVTLSALTRTPIEIISIRANRSTPGLAAQHIAAIRAVGSLCNAETTGLVIGSDCITFIPNQLRRTSVFIDIGTAGSIPLVIQAWLPVALHSGGEITIRGGTEVTRSPTIDYLIHVLITQLTAMGAKVDLSIIRRGYYPQGGGEVKVQAEKSWFHPFRISEEVRSSMGICSCSSNLPDHVTERQAIAARTELATIINRDIPVYIDRKSGISTGSSCTVWLGGKGACSVGKRGLPAEKVGKMAANELINELSGSGSVDSHLSDQLLIYLTQSGGSFTTSAVTLHAETMCWLLTQFGFVIKYKKNGAVEFSA